MQVNLFAVCAPTGALTVDIILKADYTAMFPLRIAGIPIIPGRIQDVGGSVSSPICICKDPIPRIGIPMSKIALSQHGDSSPYTLFGPPVKMIPFGFMFLISSSDNVYGCTSQYTLHSLTRLAIN